MDETKKALIFRKLDSVMYYVEDLHEGIMFFERFGLKLDEMREDIGWCNLHMEGDDLCIDLSTKIPVSGEPHYLVDNVQKFYRACLKTSVKVVRPPFPVICGEGIVIEGPSGIKLTVLDLTKFKKENS